MESFAIDHGVQISGRSFKSLHLGCSSNRVAMIMHSPSIKNPLLFLITITLTTATMIPTNLTYLHLPLPPLAAPEHVGWPPPDTLIPIGPDSPAPVPFLIKSYGPIVSYTIPVNRRIFQRLGFIRSQIDRAGPASLGPDPQSYKNGVVVMHFFLLEDWTVEAKVLSLLVTMLIGYGGVAKARGVEEGHLGPDDNFGVQGEWIGKVIWKLEIDID